MLLCIQQLYTHLKLCAQCDVEQLDGGWHLVFFIRTVIRTQAESSLQQQQQNGHMEAKHMALEPPGRRNTHQDEHRDPANKADFNKSN